MWDRMDDAFGDARRDHAAVSEENRQLIAELKRLGAKVPEQTPFEPDEFDERDYARRAYSEELHERNYQYALREALEKAKASTRPGPS